MRKWLVILLCLGFIGGCGGGDDKKAEEPTAADKKADPEPVSSKGKQWGGWRWKGKRDDCFFMVEQRCFDSLERACRAAKCKRKKKKCLKDDRAPAMVYCKGEDKPVPGARARKERRKRRESEKKKDAEDDD